MQRELNDLLEVAFPVSEVRFLLESIDDNFLFKSEDLSYVGEIRDTLD